MSVEPLAEVRSHLSAYVDKVEETHERVTITRNGRPAAVLVTLDDLDALEETIAVLSDPDTMARVRQGMKDHAAGGVSDWADVAARRPTTR